MSPITRFALSREEAQGAHDALHDLAGDLYKLDLPQKHRDVVRRRILDAAIQYGAVAAAAKPKPITGVTVRHADVEVHHSAATGYDIVANRLVVLKGRSELAVYAPGRWDSIAVHDLPRIVTGAINASRIDVTLDGLRVADLNRHIDERIAAARLAEYVTPA